MAIKMTAKPIRHEKGCDNKLGRIEGPSIKVGSLKCKHNWLPLLMIGQTEPVGYACGFCATKKPDKAKKGRPASGKVMVTMRLDPEVVAKFKAGGPGWQSRINDALKVAKLP